MILKFIEFLKEVLGYIIIGLTIFILGCFLVTLIRSFLDMVMSKEEIKDWKNNPNFKKKHKEETSKKKTISREDYNNLSIKYSKEYAKVRLLNGKIEHYKLKLERKNNTLTDLKDKLDSCKRTLRKEKKNKHKSQEWKKKLEACENKLKEEKDNIKENRELRIKISDYKRKLNWRNDKISKLRDINKSLDLIIRDLTEQKIIQKDNPVKDKEREGDEEKIRKSFWVLKSSVEFTKDWAIQNKCTISYAVRLFVQELREKYPNVNKVLDFDISNDSQTLDGERKKLYTYLKKEDRDYFLNFLKIQNLSALEGYFVVEKIVKEKYSFRKENES